MHVLVLCFIATICVLGTYSKESKYSESVNLNTAGELDFLNEEKPFRMQKVNLLWTKAKKKLSNAKLNDLYAELAVHDKYEAQLKKMRAAGKDEDGAVAAKVLRSYAHIVEHYDLDRSSLSGMKLGNEIPYDEDVEKETFFEDTKLQSMWKRAQQAGFTKKDLIMLKEEFQHQQMKINEFHYLFSELGANSDPTIDLLDPEENDVDPQQVKADKPIHALKDNIHAMKQNRTQIREGYMRLEGLITSMEPTEPTEPVFQDDRVHRLWAMAKKTDWSEKELESFKEELKHFENRLSKQAFYKEQIDQSRETLERHKQGDPEYPEKFQKLQEKTEFFDRMVNKLYTDLKTKIDKSLRHYEL